MKNFQFVKGIGPNVDQALASLELGVKQQFGNDPCHLENLVVYPEAKPAMNAQGYEVVVNAIITVVFDGEVNNVDPGVDNAVKRIRDLWE